MKQTIFLFLVICLMMVLPFSAEGSGTFVELSLTTPPPITAGNSGSCVVYAYFSDGEIRNVTNSCSYTISPSTYASISNGVITTVSSAPTHTADVTATYTSGGLTRSDSSSVSIVAVPTLVSITIWGPSSLPPNSQETYWVYANYSNGTNADVTSASTLTENSAYATMSGNILISQNVTTNKYGQITASYSGKTAYKSFCIDVNLGQ